MSRSVLRVTAGVVGADAGIIVCLFVILVAVDVAVVVGRVSVEAKFKPPASRPLRGKFRTRRASRSHAVFQLHSSLQFIVYKAWCLRALFILKETLLKWLGFGTIHKW